MSRLMAKQKTKANNDHKMMMMMVMMMMNKILVKQENESLLLIILCRRESLGALPVISEVNKDLGSRSRPRTTIKDKGLGHKAKD